MKTIPNAPTYSPCWYCQEKTEGSYASETIVQYACPNHEPLHIEWYCQRKTAGEWFFTSFNILLPGHFRLRSHLNNEHANDFYLDEYNHYTNTIAGKWSAFQFKTYSMDWVLTQTPERLLSLFQMYKTFS